MTRASSNATLAGSLVNGALIDGGPNALISDSRNSYTLGQYIFQVRSGTVVVDPNPNNPFPNLPPSFCWASEYGDLRVSNPKCKSAA